MPVEQNKNEQSPVSLATMLNAGDMFFPSNGKGYRITALDLHEVQELIDDGISIRTQLPNVTNPELKGKLDKWLKRKFRNDKGDPVNLEDLMDKEKDNWNLIDLRKAIEKMVDLSG